MGNSIVTGGIAFAAFGAGPDVAPIDVGAPAAASPDIGALDLYATVLSASSFSSAAHALVAGLAARFKLDRVSFGLHDTGTTRIVASLHLDITDPQAELHQRLLGALDEAIEQRAIVQWPLGASSAIDPLRCITLEHEALQRATGGAVASIPLGRNGVVFAAVCVERHRGSAFTSAELLRIEQLLTLAATALRWMREAEQSWWKCVRKDATHAIAKLRQPDRRAMRRALAGMASLLLFLGVAPLENAVSGRSRVEGAEQRVLAAPIDGFLGAAHVRPGDRVREGQALVDLLEGDLRLERERWSSQLAQHENSYAAAMGKSDRVAASTGAARISEAQAQLALVDERLTRLRVTAPFDALVVQGDLSQSIGGPVRQGDPLLTLAMTTEYRVIVEVDESDIGAVRKGQAGRLALSSLPWDGLDLTVERIAPLAKAVEGRNVFEVEARLATPNADLRPGLLGRADVVVGRTPPLWVWCRSAADRMRLAYWAWLG